MSTYEFGVNRMVAPRIPLRDFLSIPGIVGATGVELRNDLEGFDVLDDMSPAEVTERLARDGARVLTINAVQHFNLPDAFADAATELRRLVGYASALGRCAVVLCPHNANDDARSDGAKRADTIEGLRRLAPILEEAGVTGLVEPLGFPESSLRSPFVAADIIDAVGSDAYRITLDTFHFAVAGFSSDAITADVARLVGLVHVSGVTAAGPVAAFRDPDRVYVDRDDRVENVATVRTLLAHGYRGPVSFEPFSPTVHAPDVDGVASALRASIDFLREGLNG